jgi:hypothetical protein
MAQGAPLIFPLLTCTPARLAFLPFPPLFVSFLFFSFLSFFLLSSDGIYSPRIVMIIDFWHPDMSEVRPLLSLLLRVCCSAVFFSLYLLAFRIAPKNSLVIRRSESRLWGPICPDCARMPPWPPPTSPLARHALNCNLRLFVSRLQSYGFSSSDTMRSNKARSWKSTTSAPAHLPPCCCSCFFCASLVYSCISRYSFSIFDVAGADTSASTERRHVSARRMACGTACCSV